MNYEFEKRTSLYPYYMNYHNGLSRVRYNLKTQTDISYAGFFNIMNGTELLADVTITVYMDKYVRHYEL